MRAGLRHKRRRMGHHTARRIRWTTGLVSIVLLILPSVDAIHADEPRRSPVKSLIEATAAALSPVIASPEAKLYEGDVPLLIQPPPAKSKPPNGYVVEIAQYDSATHAWTPAISQDRPADTNGEIRSALTADWLVPEVAGRGTRWRLRARVQESDALWSAWRMFGWRPPSAAGAEPAIAGAVDRNDAGPKDQGPAPRAPDDAGPATVPADASAPRIVAPVSGAYEADITLQLAPPAGIAPEGYLIELSYWDPTARDWSEAIQQESASPEDHRGDVGTTLPLDWLFSLGPPGRWRLRARTIGPDGGWSDWVVFSARNGSSSL